MKLFFTITLIVLAKICIPQSSEISSLFKTDSLYCNCAEQMNFVIDYIETNNPAYQKIKSTKKECATYKHNKAIIEKKAQMTKDTVACFQLLKEYLQLLKDHHTNIYFTNKGIKPTKPTTDNHQNKTYEFQLLSDSINYIKLSSFSGNLENELNTFYDSISNIIMNRPYLVIDLRDNGGGNDACYTNMMKFIYTNPIAMDNVDLWASPENLRLYEKHFLKNKPLINKITTAKPNTFISISKKQKWKINNVSPLPLKVFILQNEKVASSAEDFILYAKQSKKVITIGTNTGGYTGYGNVINIETPNKLFQLQSTTTKYKKGSKYEFIGIAPDVFLNDFSNWEETVNSLISKKKKK